MAVIFPMQNVEKSLSQDFLSVHAADDLAHGVERSPEVKRDKFRGSSRGQRRAGNGQGVAGAGEAALVASVDRGGGRVPRRPCPPDTRS